MPRYGMVLALLQIIVAGRKTTCGSADRKVACSNTKHNMYSPWTLKNWSDIDAYQD